MNLPIKETSNQNQNQEIGKHIFEHIGDSDCYLTWRNEVSIMQCILCREIWKLTNINTVLVKRIMSSMFSLFKDNEVKRWREENRTLMICFHRICTFLLSLVLINLEAAPGLSCKYCVSFAWDNHNIGSMQCTAQQCTTQRLKDFQEFEGKLATVATI